MKPTLRPAKFADFFWTHKIWSAAQFPFSKSQKLLHPSTLRYSLNLVLNTICTLHTRDTKILLNNLTPQLQTCLAFFSSVLLLLYLYSINTAIFSPSDRTVGTAGRTRAEIRTWTGRYRGRATDTRPPTFPWNYIQIKKSVTFLNKFYYYLRVCENIIYT